MRKIYKGIILFIFVIGLMLLFKSEVNAASISISAPSKVTLGESCTIQITGTGAASYDVVANISGAGISDKIYLNAYTDDLQNGTKSASKTITPTSAGTITISIGSSSNVTVSGASGSQSISGSSRTITVEEVKEEPKDPEPTTPSNPEDNKTPEAPTEPEQPTKPTEPSKPSTPSNSTTDTNNKPVEDDEEEKKTEKEDKFYITSIILKGIKENEEVVDIKISPEFKKDTYEYTCNIASDIQKIELQKDAGEYTNSIIVTGLEELKDGENIIKLKLSAKDHETKIYTIKVIKEEKTIETIAGIENDEQEQTKIKKEEKKTKMVSMPLWIFIIMQIVIIVIEVLVIYFVPWRQFFNR